jgi:carbonic anhydrase/acetyltransferase-like protein (isoleucine patch superfamily)
MPLYSLGDVTPQLAPGAWAAPSADLIGDVRLGARASVWFGAVIRADNTPIVIGEESNIQDGAIGHSDPGFALTIGARVTVGHQAILHGCTIADDCRRLPDRHGRADFERRGDRERLPGRRRRADH